MSPFSTYCSPKEFNTPHLVFLHGFSGQKEDWPPIIRLLPNEWNCLSIDLPGHGTHHPPLLSDYTYSAVVDSVTKRIQNELPPTTPIHLIGYSMGGRVALGR